MTALASKLANCDHKTYDVLVVNGGHKRIATLTPHSSPIEEFGPDVSFKLANQPAVAVTGKRDEYCIWNGRIKIQRRNVGDESSGF